MSHLSLKHYVFLTQHAPRSALPLDFQFSHIPFFLCLLYNLVMLEINLGQWTMEPRDCLLGLTKYAALITRPTSRRAEGGKPGVPIPCVFFALW